MEEEIRWIFIHLENGQILKYSYPEMYTVDHERNMIFVLVHEKHKDIINLDKVAHFTVKYVGIPDDDRMDITDESVEF